VATARQEIEVGVPPAALMAVLVDFAHYPDFLPWMKSGEVLRRDGPDTWEVRFGVEVIRPLVYTLRLEREGERGLRWSLVEGVFRTNDGAWTLQPTNGGRGTLARYDIDLQVGSFVPGNVLRSLVGRDLPDLLQRFRAEAERRAGA